MLIAIPTIGYFVALLGLGLLLPAKKKTVYSQVDVTLVKTVSVFGSNMRYLERPGIGPAVVFLHGFGASLEVWEDIQSQLPDHHILAFDLIGFGGSERPRISYDLVTQARYINQALTLLNVSNVILVGHSMGGSVAATLASDNPELVKGLVLISPSAYPGSVKFSWPASLFYRPGILNSIARLMVSGSLFDFLFPENIGRQVLDVTQSYNEDFSNRLATIPQKTVLMWSYGDKRVPFEYSAEYMTRIDDCRLERLSDDVGHKLHLALPAIASAVSSSFFVVN